ncbi:thiolase family protein [Cryobacterium sp. TMT1-21]|uniref:Thiolase family protein n=1 Tax=Cryobacterium shii TaxID=1259235 RepID=A0AAQ2C7A2_9MICO|nr:MULTISPECIES: thiolase family protein [Cryobacterium]TFC49691.1 thiolase family protein [Cryobacterium shii]TFC82048.1 thiolase family protein [Cryobacterium sp. TmT2-59]TFD15586.1 thiolase family protein [Cryobacterium sp. TMT1-21]TFD19444.1 thiolase family protein [Cryobacterium sp. TMT2-23]TFD37350.1 thiolase family protein [Cryobacterium sp. TMT2-10]
MSNEAVIVDVVRTASGRGKPGGALSGVHPADLLAGVLSELVSRNGLDPALVDDVIGGCVSQVGEQGYNVTRTALLSAGFPDSVPGTTIDRQCGSSQQAVTFAAQGVMAGAYDVVIACGVESMSRVPLGSSLGRGSGGTPGQDPHGTLMHERYPQGLVNQGVSAELINQQWRLGRGELDAFAARSHRLAAAAAERGDFDGELRPVTLPGGRVVTDDETIRPGTTLASLATLPPAFRTDALAARFPKLDWHITAGNSSPLTDGASAALIMSAKRADELGLNPRARFHSFAVTGSDPLLMLTGVIPATRRILERSGLSIDDLDAYEVNEAFASVPLAWLREFDADPALLNPRGGAIALGHALGSSGTRLLGTLLNHLELTGGRWGLQTMCEGGGMANATIIERL